MIRSIKIRNVMHLLVLLYAVLPSWVASADFGNEVFSNVRLVDAEGDLVGWRFQLIRVHSRNSVLVQSFEGQPQVPCLASAQIDQSGKIEFDFPNHCDLRGRFIGQIEGSVLIGQFLNGMRGPDGEIVMTLRRITGP